MIRIFAVRRGWASVAVAVRPAQSVSLSLPETSASGQCGEKPSDGRPVVGPVEPDRAAPHTPPSRADTQIRVRSDTNLCIERRETGGAIADRDSEEDMSGKRKRCGRDRDMLGTGKRCGRDRESRLQFGNSVRHRRRTPDKRQTIKSQGPNLTAISARNAERNKDRSPPDPLFLWPPAPPRPIAILFRPRVYSIAAGPSSPNPGFQIEEPQISEGGFRFRAPRQDAALTPRPGA